MPQNNPRSIQWTPKSERVVHLLAACIRTAVRLRYAKDLSNYDSVELARIHDLQSALRTISEKLEVHESLTDNEARFKLAVNETKLISDSNLGADKIVEIREASIATLRSRQSGASEIRSVVTALHIAQQETRLWEKSYSRFMTEIEHLYKSANSQIDGLHLLPTSRVKAQSELERLIAGAIERATKI